MTQQRSNISRCFFHTKMCMPFLLLIALANCVHLLFTCLASYIVEAEPVKGARTNRQPSVDCTPFYRQHLCRGQCIQERSRPQQHMWNSKPFLIFPAELLLHKVYISNILCGLRLSIQNIDCKEKPSLAMFISTSNEYIVDMTMVKICGLTTCLIRVSVQWLTCWHYTLF